MARSSEEQIIGFVKGAEAGMLMEELQCKYGFSDASYFNWKAKLGDATL